MDEKQGSLRAAEKVLSANDVGATGTHQAGILIPKDGRLLRMFPELDRGRKNPDREVAFHVPQLDTFWTARLVFYNTKDLGVGTRSEYRLTRITGLLRELRAQPGDILRFRVHPRGMTLDLRAEETSGAAEVTKLRNGWTLMVDDNGGVE